MYQLGISVHGTSGLHSFIDLQLVCMCCHCVNTTDDIEHIALTPILKLPLITVSDSSNSLIIALLQMLAALLLPYPSHTHQTIPLQHHSLHSTFQLSSVFCYSSLEIRPSHCHPYIPLPEDTLIILDYITHTRRSILCAVASESCICRTRQVRHHLGLQPRLSCCLIAFLHACMSCVE